MSEALTALRMNDLTSSGERRWWMMAGVALAVPYAVTLVFACTGWTVAALGGPHACPLQALAEIPCPLCGGTSSWVALWQGHISEATAHNPFAALMFPAGLGALGLCLGAVLGLFDPKPILARVRWLPTGVGVGALLLLSWAWMLARH